MNAGSMEDWMTSRVAQILNIPPEEVDRTLHFTSLGLDSVSLLTFTGELGEWLGRDLAAPVAWEFPSIVELARHLAATPHEIDDTPLVRIPRTATLPLSFCQEKMWRVNSILIQTWIIRGDLNVKMLEQSVSEMVRRHEILRSAYSTADKQITQIIHPSKPWSCRSLI